MDDRPLDSELDALLRSEEPIRRVTRDAVQEVGRVVSVEMREEADDGYSETRREDRKRELSTVPTHQPHDANQ